ncbi:MAG: hypothetical protein DRQ59_05345 [Gammaproteobacteria bacterium]|nr:MAG: hypothetical protein DRQ59_05345 [Gammaproteobacteria bacterium]
MRPRNLLKFFDLSAYRKLSQDFKNPLRALLATTGALKGEQLLRTRTGSTIRVNRDDLPLWKAYLEQSQCRVEPRGELFYITPNDKRSPPYYIQGCQQCLTHSPQRWQLRDERNPLVDELECAERSVYSQHGEDGVIQALLSHFPVRERFVVEFGAYDGVCMSNSRHLIADHGWSAFLIEANDRFYSGLERCYSGNDRVKLHKGFVTEENINVLFQEAEVPEEFEVLSIDIDSIDYYVWRALTQFRPKIVIIEYNSALPVDEEYVVPKDDALRLGGTSQEGASLLSLYKLGLAKGYHLVYGELSGANLFFIHESCAADIDWQGIELIDIYQPPQFGLLAGSSAPNGRGYPREM